MNGHILFVDDYPFENIGGGEQHVLAVARGCREWGHRVGIVCAPRSGLEARARDEDFEVWPVVMGVRSPGSRKRLAKLFTTLTPDVVHAHGFHATLAGCRAARHAGVRSVLATVHTMPSAARALRPGLLGELEFRLRSALYRGVAPTVDHFVCVVNAVRDELVAMGIDASRLMVIPNGIPDPRLDANAPTNRAGTSLLVGSLGRLESPKDYRSFIEAAAIVARELSTVRFRLVGDGSLRTALEERVTEVGLGDRFEFAGWSDEPLAEILGMDIYVSSSVTETTNLTILEAMGLGKAIIATDVGGVGDAVVDGTTGYLVPPRRPDIMARRMLELVEDAPQRTAMGDAGRKRFEESFTEDRMLALHRTLYEQMMARS